MTISGIILAAGLSSRMEGGHKLLLPFGGHTIIEETISNLRKSDVSEIIIITGHQHDAIEAAVKSTVRSDTRIIFNSNYAQGRSTSIRCGLDAISNASDAALFMVADKPTVSYELMNRAIAHFKKSKPAILYVETPEGRGHPIIFSSKLFGPLGKLHGDLVGDDLIDRFRDETEIIQDDQIQTDIDDIKDYQRLVNND